MIIDSQKLPVLETWLSLGRIDEMVARIANAKATHGSAYTCCANVHMLIEAHKDERFREVVNGADFATTDGKPLAVAVKLFHDVDQPRVAGMDLLPEIFRYAERKGLRIYFYGDTDEVLGQLEARIRQEFPNLPLAGFYSPPFRALSADEQQGIIDQINASQPDILFVALGCPKQEKWMAAHRGKVLTSMVGVGNAFRAYLGIEKRAPAWMQTLSLEWLYRLIQNPQRLWKRYLITNSLFLWLIGKAWVDKQFSSKKVASAS